jgi:hypothetical protein
MGEPKPIASLSGLLLARKGAARPAMRRPAFGSGTGPATNQDDLGWNDMGYDVNPDPSTPMDHEHGGRYNPLANAVPDVKPEVRQQQERIAQQLQAQAEVGFESVAPFETELSSAPVGNFGGAQSQANTDEANETPNVPSNMPVSAEPVVAYAPLVSAPVVKQNVVTKPKARAASGTKGKAAFTLRLDSERHLKLRLACAVSNRSAQMLVTDALDAFLDAMPEIGQLAARVPTKN